MDFAVYVLKVFLFYLLEALQIAMLGRAILSWFDPECEKRISVFLLTLTEPVIFPVRVICEKQHWFEQTPVDIPFLITVILLMLVQSLVKYL